MKRATWAYCLWLGLSLWLVPRTAPAEDRIRHERTATSTASVEILADGTVRMAARNIRLIPYALANPAGDRPALLPRLATVTTDVRTRSDAEGDDPASSVSVLIEDLGGSAPRRLAEFTDPGSSGKLIAGRYFSSTVFGCCGAPNRHLVRSTENGRSLFRATGDGDMGRVGWADMPNAHPAQVRWAAFDGTVEEADLARGVVGTLAYGGDDGVRSLLHLRLRAPRATLLDANLNLSGGSELGWIDGKKTAAGQRFQQGDAEGPAEMWVAEGANAAAVGGFALVLRLGKRDIAVIPVVADRLVAAKARLAKGYALLDVVPMR